MITIPSELQAVSRCLDGWDYEVADTAKLPAAPVVSVFMTTYQHAPYIRQALDSVLMQQVSFPYEICLGEDGSTDGTREICLEYVRRYPDKIRIFLRDRANPARARYYVPYMHNVVGTLTACSARYISLLEGDDYWIDPEKMRKQVDFMDTHPDCMLCCAGYRFVSETGETMFSDNTGTTTDCKAISLPSLLWYNEVGACTSLFRREAVVAAVAHFKLLAFGDWMLWIICALNGKVFQLPGVFSCYRVHPGGIWSLKHKEWQTEQSIRVLKVLYAILPKTYHEDIRRSIGNRRFEAAFACLEDRRIIRSFYYFVLTFVSPGCSGRRMLIVRYFQQLGRVAFKSCR
jgi:glycosyltransferase involved in cell wall biosynthesis